MCLLKFAALGMLVLLDFPSTSRSQHHLNNWHAHQWYRALQLPRPAPRFGWGNGRYFQPSLGGVRLGAHAPNEMGDVSLPDREIFPQQLQPGAERKYSFEVAPGGNVSISLLPCHGQVAWNVTYVGAAVFVHPRYPTGKKRRKRCCITAGVTFNFNFDIAGLNSGLGTSLGHGAITYFQEDSSGGTYYASVRNYGDVLADYLMFASLRPAKSPFIQLPDDPQVKVTAIRADTITLRWLPVRREPWPGRKVAYCVILYPSESKYTGDVSSSSCALHRQRPTTKFLGCRPDVTRVIRNLLPNTPYDFDVIAKNLVTNAGTAYLGVTARTAPLPVTLVNSREFRGTLVPYGSRIYTWSVAQKSEVHVALSPCQGELKWSVLDSSGQPVRHFLPAISQKPSPRARGISNAGLGKSLGQVDMQYEALMNSGTYSIIVKSTANTNATFELFASHARSLPYPKLPRNPQVRVVRTTSREIHVEWDASPSGSNVTYCVHHYPNDHVSFRRILHSSCGLQQAEKRRVVAKGVCGRSRHRTLSRLQPRVLYIVDVVAKHVVTQRLKAYASVQALTSAGLGNHGNLSAIQILAWACAFAHFAYVYIIRCL